MRQIAGHSPAGLPAARIEFAGEQSDGDLRLGVRPHAVVAVVPVEVVPVDLAAPGGDAGLVGHPGPAFPQQREQAQGQREVAEMIGAPLQLESVLRALSVGRGHHAGVVDQEVDRPSLCREGVHQLRDRMPTTTGPGRGWIPVRREPERACPRRRVSPLSWLRTGITTSAPARARRAAITRPMPSLAPVTTASCPLRSGIWMSCLLVMRKALQVWVPRLRWVHNPCSRRSVDGFSAQSSTDRQSTPEAGSTLRPGTAERIVIRTGFVRR